MLFCQVVLFTGDRTRSPHLVQKTGPRPSLRCARDWTSSHKCQGQDPIPHTRRRRRRRDRRRRQLCSVSAWASQAFGCSPGYSGHVCVSPLPGAHDDDEDGTDDDDNCVRSPLGPVKHSAAARVIPGMCVCVNACTWRPSVRCAPLTCARGPRSVTHAGTNEDHE